MVTIGGSVSGEGNVVSATGDGGSALVGRAIEIRNSDGIAIAGNRVGTNAAGTAALGNADEGIYIDSSRDVRIGGPGDDDGNLVSGNGGVGIWVDSSYRVDIEENIVGTSQDGNQPLPNQDHGTRIRISTDVAVTGNLVSSNDGHEFTFNTTGLNSARSSGMSRTEGTDISMRMSDPE